MNRWNQNNMPVSGRILRINDGQETYWTELEKGERWLNVVWAFRTGCDFGDDRRPIQCRADYLINGKAADNRIFIIQPP